MYICYMYVYVYIYKMVIVYWHIKLSGLFIAKTILIEGRK